jgi:hypothetical protein
MIGHRAKTSHWRIETLTLPSSPRWITDSVLIPDYSDSLIPASTEQIPRTLRLAAADGVEDVKAPLIAAKSIAEG